MFTVKPVFTKQLEDACVNLDDQIILEAKVKQAELITWQHDGSDVTPLKDKRKILYLQGKATLKISNATLKDAGEYICKARSKGASLVEVETTSICHVSVHDGNRTKTSHNHQTIHFMFFQYVPEEKDSSIELPTRQLRVFTRDLMTKI